MIPQIKEINLPSYATLCKATVTLNDMGDKTITSQVSIDGQIAPDFSFDWEVHHMGEKFIMPLRTPQASKENTSLSSKIDLTFQHWAIYQLKRWYFFTLQNYEAGVAVADQYIASVSLNLKDFCDLYGRLLQHYFGDAITIDLNPEWQYAEEPTYIDINYSYLWDVLIKFYELFAVRWEIVPNGDVEHYVIKVGYPLQEMNHIFEYGFEGGLLKVERQVQDDNIRNMLLGRGGDKNIPYRYFKDVDPNNPTFQADPDWVEELANVYFDRLRSAEFRSYIQGWKAQHISKYSNYIAIGESNAVVPWAYRKGYTDTKFAPVEYVKDDASIKKYGELMGGLGNNDDIYPSIQGVALPNLGRIDQVVDVEQVTGDTLDEQKRNEVDSWSESVPSHTSSMTLRQKFDTVTIKIPNYKLKVPKGYTASLLNYKVSKSMFLTELGGHDVGDASNSLIVASTIAVAFNEQGNEIGGAEGLIEGEYEIGFKIELEADNVDFNKHYGRANLTISNIAIAFATAIENQKNQATFDIWIKNVWETSKGENESEEAYAERVWKPILGNHLGDEAAVCFSSGLLSTSEDYTFLIRGKAISNGIHYDTSKSLNGVQSHWRLTLVRSDADYESLGKLVPNLERQGKAGDYFYFTGIELTQYYVKWAEKRLHDYKLDQLERVSDLQPSWVVSLDKVRIGTPHHEETQSLLSQLHIGGSVRIADKRFIGESEQLYLYLQQITYKYNESQNTANLTPDTEVVLGTDYQTIANPVATIQSQIDAIHSQLGGYSTSNIQQIVRMVGDRIYLRKDGITDRSQSITYFAQLLAALGFRQGMVGGYGWGIYQDENGKWVIETDRLNVREDMQVNSLVINQIEARGGMIIESLASIEATSMEELANAYKVYFDTKHGSVGNLFRVDDVAYCHRYTAENQDLKYYKRRVMEVGEDYITLSKTVADGQGVPMEGDVIVHFGNYSDKERQYVIVRDVMGGGYERMLSGLDSVTAIGNEYYFAGYQSSSGERFFIGTRKDNQYIEYINGKLYIPGQLILGSDTGGGKTMLDYIRENGGLSQDEIEKIAQEKAKAEADKAQKEAKEYADAVAKAVGDDLQNQIDGKIETWFGDGVPSLKRDEYPMREWEEPERDWNDILEAHAGDLYYDNETGYAYRFSKENGQWTWITITDEAITKALAAAKEKKRIFTDTPRPPYDINDLWVNATYSDSTHNYKDDILVCKQAKESGSFSIEDWGLASDYTNDDYAHSFDYLSKALNDGRTEIGGGLILSSLIALGTWDGSFQTIYSGINGQPLTAKDDPDYIKKGLGIAAWYGGDMLDKEYPQTPLPSNPRYSQSLFRFDGSGYLSGGAISWNKDGQMTFNTNIAVGGSTLAQWQQDIASLTQFLNALGNVLVPVDNGGNILRDANNRLDWGHKDMVAVRVYGKGLYADTFISAMGINSETGSGDTGSGGTGGGGLNEEQLADYLTRNNYAKKSDISTELGRYLPLTGGTITGNLDVEGYFWIKSSSGEIGFNILDNRFFGPTVASNGKFELGRSDARWSTLYANSINVTNTALVGNLNADMLDGKHNGELTAENLSYLGNTEAIGGTTAIDKGLRLYGVYNNGYPCMYGNLLRIGGGGGGELLAEWTGGNGLGRLYYRSKRDVQSEWSGWGTVAYLTDNVASATQLQTSRNLWGQPFNGTGDVDGVMEINYTGNDVYNAFLQATDPNIPVNGHCGLAFGRAKSTNNQAQIWHTHIGDGSTNNYLSFGAWGKPDLMIVRYDGSVGIGTTTLPYKFTVNGDILADGWIRVRGGGNRGFFFESYGGGFYMQDTEWIRTYGSKNFYHDTGIMRTDGEFQVGINGNRLIVKPGGNVGIGISNPAFTLDVRGTGYFSGNVTAEANLWVELQLTATQVYAVAGIWSDGYVSAMGQNTSSDERLKMDFRPLKLTLEQITNAPSVMFRWRKDGSLDFGSIAQYWQRINPLFAREHKGYLTLDYGKIAMSGLIAVSNEVLSDKARISQLEREVGALKAKLKGA